MYELGKLSKSDLKKALTDFFKSKEETSYEELKTQINGTIVSSNTTEICEKHQLIPTGEVEYAVQVLAKNIEDDSLKELEFELQKDIIVTIIEGKFFDLLNKPILSNLNSSLVVSRDLTSDQKLHDQDPYVRLLFEGFRSAKKLGASDIHFEPYEYHLMTSIALSTELMAEFGKISDGVSLYASSFITAKLYQFYAIYSWLQMIVGPLPTVILSYGLFSSFLKDSEGEQAPPVVTTVKDVGMGAATGGVSGAAGAVIRKV